jgi:hypothetical protein
LTNLNFRRKKKKKKKKPLSSEVECVGRPEYGVLNYTSVGGEGRMAHRGTASFAFSSPSTTQSNGTED